MKRLRSHCSPPAAGLCPSAALPFPPAPPPQGFADPYQPAPPAYSQQSPPQPTPGYYGAAAPSNTTTTVSGLRPCACVWCLTQKCPPAECGGGEPGCDSADAGGGANGPPGTRLLQLLCLHPGLLYSLRWSSLCGLCHHSSCLLHQGQERQWSGGRVCVHGGEGAVLLRR